MPIYSSSWYCKKICCHCKTLSSSCRKHTLDCTELCFNCHSETCTNIKTIVEISPDNVEDVELDVTSVLQIVQEDNWESKDKCELNDSFMSHTTSVSRDDLTNESFESTDKDVTINETNKWGKLYCRASYSNPLGTWSHCKGQGRQCALVCNICFATANKFSLAICNFLPQLVL